MSVLRRILLPVMIIVLAACTADPPPQTIAPTAPAMDPNQPPAVDFARDVTYPDGRLITDPRFAAAIVMSTTEVRLFDDIGRMISQVDAAGQTVSALWVHDYDDDLWLPADTALFVGSANLVTPRGSGLLAVASLERAEQVARELGGQVMSLAAIPAYLAAGPAAPLPAPGGGLELGGLIEADTK